MLLQEWKGRIYVSRARTKNSIHNYLKLSDKHRQTIYQLKAVNLLLRMNIDREVVIYV